MLNAPSAPAAFSVSRRHLPHLLPRSSVACAVRNSYEWVVFRRFSEFVTLHAALKSDPRLAQTTLPPLPSKMPGISATLRSKHLSDEFLLKRCREMHAYLHALLMLPALHWCDVSALPRCLVAFLEIQPGRVDPLLAKSNQENRALYEAAVVTKRKMEAAFEVAGAGAARDAEGAKAGGAGGEAASFLSLLASEETGDAAGRSAEPSAATTGGAPKFPRDRRRESASLGGVASFGAGIDQTDRAQRIALRISRRIDPLAASTGLDPSHSAGLVVIDEQERAKSAANTPELGATVAPGSPPLPLSPALPPAASPLLSSASEAASAPPAPPTDSTAEGVEERLSSSLDGASLRGTKQVLVILGGPLTIDGRPGAWLTERLDIGARVFAQWEARGVAERVLIVTGGDCRGTSNSNLVLFAQFFCLLIYSFLAHLSLQASERRRRRL